MTATILCPVCHGNVTETVCTTCQRRGHTIATEFDEEAE